MEAKNWYNLAKENAPPSPPPKMTERVKNFAGSLVKYMATGMNRVSDDIQKTRMDICKSCEFYNQAKSPYCSKCGCFLNIKTTWGSEGWPVGKWNSIAPPKGKGCGGCGRR